MLAVNTYFKEPFLAEFLWQVATVVKISQLTVFDS